MASFEKYWDQMGRGVCSNQRQRSKLYRKMFKKVFLCNLWIEVYIALSDTEIIFFFWREGEGGLIGNGYIVP